MTKTFLFAGGSSKVALSCAQLLKNEGHKVMAISTKNNLPVYDSLFEVIGYDFGTFPNLTEKIDGLVYFPGTINLKPFHRFSREDFMHDYSVNTMGAVAFVQSYLHLLKQSELGSIVFISSVASSTGMSFHSSVAMAKSALEGLVRALAAELAPGIRVNCVAPSLINTPLAEKFINTPEKAEASKLRHPLKKIGEDSDVAHAIQFLLSEQSKWITGQTIAIDGGMNHLK